MRRPYGCRIRRTGKLPDPAGRHKSASSRAPSRVRIDAVPGDATASGPSTSVLAPERALVPLVQQEIFERREAEEDRDAQDRQQHQRGKHARDVEPVARFDDAPGEAGAGPGAGDKFGNDGADEREPAGDLHTAQEVWKGA